MSLIPFYHNEEYKITLYHGDCLSIMHKMGREKIHAIVTDPPYGLEFMGKDWDKTVPGQAYWSKAYRVARPGSFMLSFGGTRTFHRLACAIEDGHWQINDTIMWLYGNGFPKSHDISKGIDNELGASRKVIGQKSYGDGHQQNSHKSIGYGGCDPQKDQRLITAPTNELAKQWEGYGTALKPAYEPIILASKDCDKTYATNARRHGTGGLNIDGCRIGNKMMRVAKSDGSLHSQSQSMSAPNTNRIQMPPKQGRWPANIIHDGSKEVLEGFGSNIQQSRFFYCSKVSKSERGSFNNHPTVKPLALMRYLIRLISPPKNGIILDPFNGSGTTGVACVQERQGYVGIELCEHNLEITVKRIEKAIESLNTMTKPSQLTKSYKVKK
jgi:DNA modification methylase